MNLMLLIEELSDLPADAPEWESMPSFIENVQQIMELKRRDREAGREELKRALEALKSECDEPLKHFQWSDYAKNWSAGSCPAGAAAKLADNVNQFNSMLMRHRELRSRLSDPNNTHTELNTLVENLAALGSESKRQYNDIAAVLTGGEAPSPQPPSSVPPQHDSSAVVNAEIELGAESINGDLADSASDNGHHATVTPVLPTPDIELPAVALPDSDAGQAIVISEEVEQSNLTLLPQPPVTSAEAVAPVITPRKPGGSEVKPKTKQLRLAVPREDTKRDPDAGVLVAKREPLPAPAISEETWHALLWTLIANDDLAGAYWLAWALNATGLTAPVSEWMMLAVQGGRWISSNTDPLISNLHKITNEYQPQEDSRLLLDETGTLAEAVSLLSLAASLPLVLIAPDSGFQPWLKVPGSRVAALGPLVKHIFDFTALGIPLLREELNNMATAEQSEEVIDEIIEEAALWLETGPNKRHGNRVAQEVWRYLSSNPQGDLRQLLVPVSENRVDQLNAVQENIKRLQDEYYVNRRIDEVHHEHLTINTPKISTLEGLYRDQIVRHISEPVELARRWCEAVKWRHTFLKRGDYLIEQAWALRQRVEEVLPPAEEALRHLCETAGQGLPVSAAARCLLATLAHLRAILNLPPAEQDQKPPESSNYDWLIRDERNLFTATAKRLWLLPEIKLNSEGRLDNSFIPHIPGALRDSRDEGRTIEAAFAGWIRAQDYRYAHLLLNALDDEGEARDLLRRYHEALEDSRQKLQEQKLETADLVEQSMIDDIIAEAERIDYIGLIEAINVDETLDFISPLETLREIQSTLQRSRQDKLERFESEWQSEIEPQLSSRSDIPRPVLELMRSQVTEAFSRNDVRVLSDYLTRIKETLKSVNIDEKLLDSEWKPHLNDRNLLKEFKEADKMISEQLGIDKEFKEIPGRILQGRNIPGMRLSGDDDKRKEIVSALEAWRSLKLKVKDENGRHNYADHILTILRFLGYVPNELEGAALKIQPVPVTDVLQAQAKLSAGGEARPIPHFGTYANGSMDVACLWASVPPSARGSRPNMMRPFGARLHDIKPGAGRSLLLIYLGALSESQRLEMTGIARTSGIPLAILDEKLLLFLAGEEHRLNVFIHCAMPYSGVNPYNPYVSAPVAEEMFFGRKGLLSELVDPYGPGIIYGGRQLGKSALIRQMERVFHKPERHQYAWVEDMEQAYGPHVGKDTEYIWRRLRDRFNAADIIKTELRKIDVSAEKTDSIRGYILKAMKENPELGVLYMLDEADAFIYADSKDNFRVIASLKSLMTDTSHRFKVVFTGNYNVHRFDDIPNQPLEQFGPLPVGPMEPSAARDMVRLPFKALGYNFEDERLIFRILSYTNYHAGLIQNFCYELLKRLHRDTNYNPPYIIRQHDVDAVYREVRADIRHRFNMTLQLDETRQYEAIIWTIIVDQVEKGNTYAKEYTVEDLLNLVRSFWPLGFKDVSLAQMEVRLDEMKVLGVLMKDEKDKNKLYRLRSPNIVRLIGTKDEIWSRLSELADKRPVERYNITSYHSWLDDKPGCYSPLTFEQDRLLAHASTGVGLIFASQAQGADLVAEAFTRYIPKEMRDEGVADWAEVPSDITDGIQIKEWLKDFVDKRPGHQRLMIYQKVTEDVTDPAGCIKEAMSFWKLRRAEHRSLWIMFLFDPRAAWKWMQSPEVSGPVEEQVGVIISPPAWDFLGIRQRLTDLKKDDHDDVCRAVLEATGGWPLLLDELFNRHEGAEKLTLAAQEFARELLMQGNALQKKFLQSLGLDRETLPWNLLKVMRELGEGTIKDIHEFVPLVTEDSSGTIEEVGLAIEYLKRMGCVKVSGDTVLIDPVMKAVFPQPESAGA